MPKLVLLQNVNVHSLSLVEHHTRNSSIVERVADSGPIAFVALTFGLRSNLERENRACLLLAERLQRLSRNSSLDPLPHTDTDRQAETNFSEPGRYSHRRCLAAVNLCLSHPESLFIRV